MTAIYLTPPAISFLLLAAHFYRAENLPAIVVSMIMIGLILVRRPWAARAVQIGLIVGALEWLRSTAALVGVRSSMGEPFLRLMFILGGVALCTLLCALILQSRRIKAYFGFDSTRGENGGAH